MGEMGERVSIAAGEGSDRSIQHDASDAFSVPWGHFERPGIAPISIEKDDGLNTPGKVVMALEFATITGSDDKSRMVTTRPEHDGRPRVVTIGPERVWDILSHTSDIRVLRQSWIPGDGKAEAVDTYYRPIVDGMYAVSEVRNGPGGVRTLAPVVIVDQAEATRRITALSPSGPRQEPALSPLPSSDEAPVEQPQTDAQQSVVPAEQPALQEAAASSRGRKRFRPGFRHRAERAAPTEPDAKLPEQAPQGAKGNKRAGRKARLGVVVVAATATAVAATGTGYVLSAPAPAAHSAAPNIGRAEGASVIRMGSISAIGGAAVRAVPHESPSTPRHHSTPVQVKPPQDLDVAPWVAAARGGDPETALSRVEGSITRWDITHPKEAVHLGLSNDGKWEVLRMNDSNQVAGKGVTEGVNQDIYRLAA